MNNIEIVKVGKHSYKITDDPIENGNLIYSIYKETIDKCVAIFEDGTICVEFGSGMRAILSDRHFKRSIKI